MHNETPVLGMDAQITADNKAIKVYNKFKRDSKKWAHLEALHQKAILNEKLAEIYASYGFDSVARSQKELAIADAKEFKRKLKEEVTLLAKEATNGIELMRQVFANTGLPLSYFLYVKSEVSEYFEDVTWLTKEKYVLLKRK